MMQNNFSWANKSKILWIKIYNFPFPIKTAEKNSKADSPDSSGSLNDTS